MKKILLMALALCLGTMAVTSCNKDDDSIIANDNINYLCFTAEEAGSTVYLSYTTYSYENHSDNDVTENPIPIDLEYSTDRMTWHPFGWQDTIKLAQVGDKVFLRGYNPERFSLLLLNDKDELIKVQRLMFKMTGSIAASGNIMTLVDRTGTTRTIPQGSCGFFCALFADCSALTEAPELPATTLAKECYESMFSKCTRLRHAPALPATTLAEECYRMMFYGCTSITKAPELPATQMKTLCYFNTFMECTSLTEVPALPATQLAEYCYVGMFVNCTALERAPELPARHLVEGCYNEMFACCRRLQYVKALFDATDDDMTEPRYGYPQYTDGWLVGVASQGTFVKASDASWTTSGASGVPNGWTVERE